MQRWNLKLCYLCVLFVLAGMLGAGCAAGDDLDPTSGEVAGGEFCQDQDGDGYLGMSARCQKGTDCDDLDDSIHPGASEVCGDGRDNDCANGDAPCELECVDQDGDHYGVGDGCLGPDCDDSNPQAHPGVEEICGNGIDEDCDSVDNVCPTNCTDMDGDGYGLAGNNSDCAKVGDDCDDSNPAVNPGASEVCNGVDDNCDAHIDECEQSGANCSGTSTGVQCVVEIGASCSHNDQCSGAGRCDPSSGECRLPEGERCQAAEECLDGYACSGGVCSGDFCDINACSGQWSVCSADAERCVECDPDASESGGCPGSQTCSFQGFCADTLLISDSDPVENHPEVTNDIYALSLAIADCWIDYNGASTDQLCALLYLGENVAGPITEHAMDDAFYTSKSLEFLDALHHDALKDLWGHGVFNLVDIVWSADPRPNTFLEYCVWYHVRGKDKVYVDKCSNFSP